MAVLTPLHFSTICTVLANMILQQNENMWLQTTYPNLFISLQEILQVFTHTQLRMGSNPVQENIQSPSPNLNKLCTEPKLLCIP
jgi:hypothetical protein